MAGLELNTARGLDDFQTRVVLRTEEVNSVGLENIGGAENQVGATLRSGYIRVFNANMRPPADAVVTKIAQAM